MDVYECEGHTDAAPKWGCKLYVDGLERGHAVDCRNTQLAKEEACKMAADALGLEYDDW
jgi:hypothetical protein